MVWYSHLFKNFPQFLVEQVVVCFETGSGSQLQVSFLPKYIMGDV